MTDDTRWPPLLERLAHAARRCRDLNAALEALRQPDALTFVRVEAADRTELVFTPEFADPLATLRLGLLLGEIGHQCRSVLDNLAWQFALETTATPPRTTCFPICDTRREFHRMKNDQPHPASGLAKISALPQVAQDRIEQVQPFHRAGQGTRHALSLIRDLHDGDKHRVPVITAIQTREVKAELHLEQQSENDPREVDVVLLNDGRLRHSEPLLVLRGRAPWLNISAKVHWDAQFRVEVASAEVPGLQRVTTSLLTQTAAVLMHVADLFGADPESVRLAATVPA